MVVKRKKIVVDTNVFISGILFRGKPGQIIELVYLEKVHNVISRSILTELQENLLKKFKFSEEMAVAIENQILEVSQLVLPKITINALKNNNPDNRVLETAVAGKCDHIITGDKELLKLAHYRSVRIVTPDDFLKSP